ncbi:electron transfer flavoprotein-quinone oxidoreductase [Desulfitispora alkaliphila]|uniref:FAD-dependent oxidoreductase n=1 Tax=Desulfitispora alkaliphila TaxID=622674 RepID=UPI003D1BFA6F
MTEKFDSIVVGAGPAGIAAAYTMAKAGLNVVMIERGDHPGAKNVMGGVLYRQPTEELFPEFWKADDVPLERHLVEQRVWVLDEDSAVTMGYKTQNYGEEPYNNFTVIRGRFDRWLADRAVEAGALLITETVVEEFLYDGDKVIGVRTGRDQGDLHADVVICAEGVNSLLTQKAGLQKHIATDKIAVAVKENIALPKGVIEDRFNIEGDQGATIELVGNNTLGMLGTGFIYTNKDSLSVGVGAILSQVAENGIAPYQLLEHMKKHPMVKPLLQGGEIKEYLAHLIPEGGYDYVPKLYADGLMIVGDAAMLCNGFHREGSNLAMTSGRFAAETVIEAKEQEDYSVKVLSKYKKKLEDSFVLKDLKKYRHAGSFFEANPHFFTSYPGLLNYAAKELTTVDSTPKREKQQKIIRKVKKERSLYNISKDLFRAWRVMG